MNTLSKRIELLANIAIIAVALLLGFVLVKNYLLTRPAKTVDTVATNQPSGNTKIALPDVEWAKNDQTLVLAVSSTCHFCTESAPFYQQLAKTHSRTRLIAVFPQPVDEGKRYLERLGVPVDEVKQASLDSINVRGTPTLMLVNSNGVVVQKWVGKLPAEQEAEVLSKI